MTSEALAATVPVLPLDAPAFKSFWARRAFIAAATTGSILLAAVPSGEQVPAPESNTPVVHVDLPLQNLNSCPEVPPTVLDAVDKLVNEPEHPAIKKRVSEAAALSPMKVGDQKSNSIIASRSDVMAKVRGDIARETGVTMHDPTPYIQKMQNRLTFMPAGQTPRFADFLATTQEFASRYGVAVRMGTAEDRHKNQTPASFQPAKPPGHYDDLYTVQSLINIIEDLGELPEEYVRQIANLHQILLYDGEYAVHGGHASAEQSAIEFPLARGARIGRDTLQHEVGHLVAYRLCGGSYKADPQYTRLGNDRLSNGEIAEMNLPHFKKRNAALAVRDFSRVCEATASIRQNDMLAGALTNYEAAYGFNEGHADGIMLLTGGQTLYNRAFRPDAPPRLRQRAEILAGRIYQASPQIGTFFLNAMSHTIITDPFEQACASGDWHGLAR